jgi:uncharacterized protein
MTHFIVKFRWWIIAACTIAGITFASLIPLSKTDPEIRNYVPNTLESRISTDRIEKEFGTQDMVVVLFSDSSILNPEDLTQIRDVDRGLSRIPAISQKISPFSIKAIKGQDGFMTAERLIRAIPRNSSEIQALKDKIAGNTLASGTVISSDFKTAAISATIDGSNGEIGVLNRIDSVLASVKGPATTAVGGLPYIRKYLMKDVKTDAVRIVPAALLIMLLILKITLREWKRLLIPFTVVVLSTAITMGLIPLFGWKISIITLLVPVIMVAVANNYGIYLVARHQEISRNWQGDNFGIIKMLTGSLNMPILFSGLTTIAGILGLLTHSIIPARQVGILAAIGVSLALIMSLILIPALLYIRGPEKSRGQNSKSFSHRFDRAISSLSGFIVRHPGKILIGTALVTLVLSIGIFYVRIDTNQENYFPKNHPIRKASNIINSSFGGSQTISVMISGDIKDPVIMKKIDTLTGRLIEQEGVGNVFSISRVVREMSKAIYTKGEAGYDMIPDSREGIAQLFELYNMSGDQGDFDQLMNLDNSKAHILIRLSDSENRIIVKVRDLISSQLQGIKADIVVGGYAIIMADFAESIIRGQVLSLMFAVLTVFILLALIFKSLRGGMIGTIPLAASILILFGFMGFTGIALDAATALLSSVMIGVGVDFTIQYVWCFNSQLMEGMNYADATKKALGTIGRSIMINAFSVMAGFSALMLSGFTSIRFFGYLVFISIGSCLVGAIVVIPAFLLVFRPKFVEKDLTHNKKNKYEKENNLIPSASPAFSSGTGTAS